MAVAKECCYPIATAFLCERCSVIHNLGKFEKTNKSKDEFCCEED